MKRPTKVVIGLLTLLLYMPSSHAQKMKGITTKGARTATVASETVTRYATTTTEFLPRVTTAVSRTIPVTDVSLGDYAAVSKSVLSPVVPSQLPVERAMSIQSVNVTDVDLTGKLLFSITKGKHYAMHALRHEDGSWVYQLRGDREIVLQSAPQLPNGVKDSWIGRVFSVERGKELLNVVLDSYADKYLAEVAGTKAFVELVYDSVREDAGWNVSFSFTSMLRDEEFMAYLAQDMPVPLSLETVMQHTPDIFQAVNMLSLREYMVLNGLVFPKYGTEAFLDVTVDSVASRLLKGEINPSVSDMFTAIYLHSVNARDISVILKDVEKFLAEHGRLPGVKRWTTAGKAKGNVRIFTGADRATPEEWAELSLGTEFLIAVKAVPVSSFAWRIDPEVQQKMALWANKIDQEVSALQAE